MYTKKELEAILQIRNFLVHQGRMPSVRELMRLLKYRSPYSVTLILKSLLEKKTLERRTDGRLQLLNDIKENTTCAQTVDVPLVGIAACGTPIIAEENIEGMISVSIKLARPPYKYFLLKARGDSMDKAGIKDGDLVLVKQHPIAENGQIVVALINDEATIKELNITPGAVLLKPRSTNPKHKQIILDRDFHVQGIVVATIPDL
jgi:repressor LexA